MPERNVDNINIRISQANFIEMYKAHVAYPKATEIHIDQATKKGDYVTLTKFLNNLMPRWKAYRKAHNDARPAAIWTLAPPVTPAPAPTPTPVVAKPTIIKQLESAYGMTINNATDYYHLVQIHGIYAHYNCVDFKDTNTAIGKIKVGMNCADNTYLGTKVLDALKTMGIHYTYEIMHVECDYASHLPDPTAGHFFIKINGGEFSSATDYDLAEAASGKRGIGSTMCVNGYVLENHTLCFN